jgi:hypothetical protein
MSDSASDPSVLYHYTDAAGLLGIIKGSSWDIDPAWRRPLLRASAGDPSVLGLPRSFPCGAAGVTPHR